MTRFDEWMARATRQLARRTSRRSLLAGIGGALLGTAAIPLLPVSRASGREPQPGEPDPDTPEGQSTSCEYWRYCSIDGFLSSCCGGTHNSCPPGTSMAPVTWIGTCRNPADGKDYIISYNDCCGKSSCGNCLCQRNEGDRPVYNPRASNDLNWCLGTKSSTYHCSTAIVIGTAIDE